MMWLKTWWKQLWCVHPRWDLLRWNSPSRGMLEQEMRCSNCGKNNPKLLKEWERE